MPPSRGRRTRPVGTRDPRPRVLVVCEGQKTEPSYFKAFPMTSATVHVVGLGANTLSVVDHTVRERDAAAANSNPFEHVWCVVDRDSFPKAHVNEAVERCGRESIGAAWSNEAFELWYLLHFAYCDAATSRDTYAARLGKFLERPYKKNLPDIYEQLHRRMDTALRNAANLAAFQAGKPPADANPMTTVHELVELLRKHSRR